MFPVQIQTDILVNVEPHVTLLYLGEIPDLPYTKEQLVEVMKPYLGIGGGFATPKRFELFGENKDHLVVTLDDWSLQILRSLVLKVVDGIGGKNGSSFKDFNPHVTLLEDYSGELDNLELPASIHLGPLEIWWGDEQLNEGMTNE